MVVVYRKFKQVWMSMCYLSHTHTYHTIMHNAPKSLHVPNASYSEQIQYDACAYTTTGHARNAIINVTNIYTCQHYCRLPYELEGNITGNIYHIVSSHTNKGGAGNEQIPLDCLSGHFPQVTDIPHIW